MYGISIANHGFVRSEVIATAIYQNRGDHPDAMTHLTRIENLEARGMQYANHDFDVLSAAWHFAYPATGFADEARAVVRQTNMIRFVKTHGTTARPRTDGSIEIDVAYTDRDRNHGVQVDVASNFREVLAILGY